MWSIAVVAYEGGEALAVLVVVVRVLFRSHFLLLGFEMWFGVCVFPFFLAFPGHLKAY